MKSTITATKELCGKHDVFTLVEMTEMLNAAVINLPEEQRNSARFEIDNDQEMWDDREYPKLFISWKRLETDAEHEERLTQEKKYSELQDVQQRRQYEILQAKFGNMKL